MQIKRPTLLLNLAKAEANLDTLIKKAQRTQTELIPHFKTHQSKEIGELFRARGIDKITVSSVKMASYFAANGWNDITIAFPFNILEVEEVNRMVKEGCTITLLVTEIETVQLLADRLAYPVQVLIEIDAGYGRSGIQSQALDQIQDLLDAIEGCALVNLYGLYCHPGNTYQAKGIEEIRQIWSLVIKRMNFVKNKLVTESDIKIRIGDTPGCTVVEAMNGVDEIGPGNFIFYDLVMNYLNVCAESQIAVAVACPVVAKKEGNRLIIHGGAVHFSKDHLVDADQKKFYGEMVILEEKGWSQIIPDAKLVSISQEHGVLEVDAVTFETIRVGDVVGILPIHSCLTANLMKSYHTLDGRLFEHLEKIC